MAIIRSQYQIEGSVSRGELLDYPGIEYYVDGVNGDDTNDGRSWQTAVATIQKGVNLARYLPGTTTIDDTKDHFATVYVGPGHYNEQVLFSGYNIRLLGIPVHPGKDYGVSLNYDAAITETACLAFSGSGIEVANIWVNNSGGAIPGIWCAGGDNNWVHNCVIDCGGVGAYGIKMDSMKGSLVEGNTVETPATAGILVAGGDDHYFIQGAIRHNAIHGDASAVVAIDIEATNVCYSAVIERNFIDVLGSGASAYGIYNRATGNVLVVDNFILLTTGANAVASNGKGLIHNHTSANGTITDPDDDD